MSLFDAMLDQDLTEIADLPTYEVPPKGIYKLLVFKVEQKEVEVQNKDKQKIQAPVIQFDWKVVEPLELVNPEEAESIKPDTQFSESYFFHNDPEKTKAALKDSFKEVASSLGIKNLKQLVEQLQGLEVIGNVKHRVDKNDKEKIYAQVRDIRLT